MMCWNYAQDTFVLETNHYRVEKAPLFDGPVDTTLIVPYPEKRRQGNFPIGQSNEIF
jgi:hypothetical protein